MPEKKSTLTHGLPRKSSQGSNLRPRSLKVIENFSEFPVSVKASGVESGETKTHAACIPIPRPPKLRINGVPLLLHCITHDIAFSGPEIIFVLLVESHGFNDAIAFAAKLHLKCKRTLGAVRKLLKESGNGYITDDQRPAEIAFATP
jgi:hypothetical protein